jgi:thiol-disulfide isomerase/thioredoxin
MIARFAAIALGLVLVACSQPAQRSAEGDPTATPATEATTAQTPAPSPVQADPTESPHAAATPHSTPEDTAGPLDVDPLHAVALVDVRSGETFTLGELASEKPVVLEPMAIWCSSCLAQQRQVAAAHDAADFHSVSLDVDPHERAPDLARYADREGFDWHFAIAEADLANELSRRFGNGVLLPPLTPKILLFPDGSVRALEFGRIRDADEIVAELAAG